MFYVGFGVFLPTAEFQTEPASPLMLLHMMLGLKRESFVWRSVVWTVNLTVDFLTNQKFYQSTNIHLLKLNHYLSRLSILELIQITGESSFFISWKFNFWKITFFILVNPWTKWINRPFKWVRPEPRVEAEEVAKVADRIQVQWPIKMECIRIHSD